MSVDSVSRKHDRIPFIRFLGVYLLFQWRRQCARLHRARIALYSRRFGQWIQLRAAVSADQSAPPSVAAVVPASGTQTPPIPAVFCSLILCPRVQTAIQAHCAAII